MLNSRLVVESNSTLILDSAPSGPALRVAVMAFPSTVMSDSTLLFQYALNSDHLTLSRGGPSDPKTTNNRPARRARTTQPIDPRLKRPGGGAPGRVRRSSGPTGRF